MDIAEFPTQEIHDLIVEGRMLDAWEMAQATGIALPEWPHGKPRRTAARLASCLGNSRLGGILDWLNWRDERDNPTWFFHALFSRSAWLSDSSSIAEITRRLGGSVPTSTMADLTAMRGSLLAGLRDFTPAFRDIETALELAPSEAWIHVIHSSALERADRYEQALEAARQAVALRPRYAAAVKQLADNLIHLGRDDEAIDLLEEADAATQNAAFATHLQSLYSEREDHDRALNCLRTAETRSPLASKRFSEWIAGRRADFLLMKGDIDACIEWSERKGKGFHKHVARKLRIPGARDRKRVRLDVPFTRQHAMTCAPATLASLAAYWNRPYDHLAIADAICHEGTPWHKERRWAEDHGFHTVEFRLTPDALHHLIDRGIPFTLTTQAVTSAHLQACIGYDDRTGVILLRDPTERHYGEMFLDALIEDHPISGPRGMVMIPRQDASRLDGLILPDAALFDAYHDLLASLDGHERFPVEAALAALRAVGGDAPLVHDGSERVASWKCDWVAQLEAVERQLATAPKHQPILLRKAGILRKLGRVQDLREFLEEIVRWPDADPVFNSELGELLMEDARLLERAESYLRKAVRQRRRDSRPYSSLAWCRAKQQHHEEAAALHRISSCLSPDFDPYARNYFDTSRIIRRQDEAIDFLHERAHRFGTKTAGAWTLLADALNTLDQVDEAAAVLREGARARPGDGDFQLAAGSMMAAWGEPHRSQGLEWMEAAQGRSSEAEWLAETARITSFLGDRAKATRCWRKLCGLQPRRIQAWRGLAALVADEDGPDAAIELLDQATLDFPEITELWTLKSEYLRGTKRGPIEALDRAIETDPGSLWALRERATRRMEADDGEGALLDAQEAVHRHPWDPAGYGALGWIHEQSERSDAAAEAYRKAIRLDVDYTYAAERLLGLSDNRETRKRELALLQSEMDRQVSNGEIVPDYQELAWPLIEPPLLLKQLQDFCVERPDLWQTWSARIEQALRMHLDGEALAAATELTTRFPLMPLAWLELARTHRSAGRHSDEVTATGRAVHLSPAWDKAAREHADVLELLGRTDEAVDVLKRASELEPLSGANHGYLAGILRRLERHADALDALLEGLRLCPFYEWGWEHACRWAIADDRKDEMVDLLRRTSDLKDHHRAWWPIAADCWDDLGEPDEALSAIRRGLELRPKDATLRDKLAYQHFNRREYDLAIAACLPVDGETDAPVNLRGRHAWILLHSGQPVKGVEAMRRLLDEHPDYAWIFGELATYYESRSDWQALRDHSKRWLRTSPHHTRALACLGLAEHNLENRDAARAAYARAHAIDPAYRFVARQLLDLQMEAREFNAAATTLASLQHYAPSPWITCDAVELELRRGDHDAAFGIADKLIGDPDAGFDVFNWLEDLCTKHAAENRFRKWIGSAVRTPPIASPGALANWIGTLPVASLATTGYKRLLKEPAGGPAREEAWTALLNYCASNDLGGKVKKWSKRHRAELHTKGPLWTATGTAFLTAGLYKDGVAWFADWRSRPDDFEVAGFVNLAALHDSLPGNEQDHLRKARELRAEGLNRFPDDTWEGQALRAGLALQLATDGEIEAARKLAENLEEDRCSDYYSGLGHGARAILASAAGDEEDAEEQLTVALEKLGSASRLGAGRHRKHMLRAVASHLPWTRGKASRLRKQWSLPRDPRPLRFWEKDIGFPLWPVWITLFLLSRACVHIMSDS